MVPGSVFSGVKYERENTSSQGPIGGSMEPCGPEIFVVEPGAQSLSQLGARTKMLFGCMEPWSEAMEP